MINSISTSIKILVNTLNTTLKTIKLIYKYEKWQFILTFIISISSGITSIISINIFGKLIDIVSSETPTKIFYFILLQTVFALAVLILSNFKKYVDNKLQLNLTHYISIDVLKKCTEMSLKDFENSSVKDNLQYIQSQLSIKPFQTITATFSIISSLSTSIFAICFIADKKPSILIIMLIPLLVSFIFYIYLSSQENKTEQNCSAYSRRSWYLENLLIDDSTFKEVKFFKISNYILNKYKTIEQKSISQNIKISKLEFILSIISSTIKQIAFASILFIIFIPLGISKISIGVSVNLFNITTTLYVQLENILNNFYEIHQSKLYMSKLFEFLKANKKSNLDEETVKSINSINITNLSFKYPNSKSFALQDINLSIKKGETIAIIGANGSGKSTLIKLLLGFYKSPKDTIFINQVPINKLNIDSLHEHISVLFQDFTKYELTLRENVGFGKIQNIHDSEEIKSSLKKSNCDDYFTSNIDSQLGFWFHTGTQLSGGQWKKIAIARTFFRKADLCILDEPNASIDLISNQKVMQTFLEYTKNKIGIFITHKISNAMLADKIVLMKNGKISEIGTHKELMQTSSHYRKLCEINQSNS